MITSISFICGSLWLYQGIKNHLNIKHHLVAQSIVKFLSENDGLISAEPIVIKQLDGHIDRYKGKADFVLKLENRNFDLKVHADQSRGKWTTKVVPIPSAKTTFWRYIFGLH